MKKKVISLKKLTKKEQEAYRIVQSLRGKASAEKRGKKGMSKAGKKGAKILWEKRRKEKLSTSQ